MASIGAVELRQLFSFSNHVILLLGLSIFLMLIVGLICSLICSRRLARPISCLSAEVAAVQKNRRTIPNLSLTGIRELDQFSTAITTLSRDILMTSTKFLRIMDMASIELGGYEIRFDTGSVYFTDNFFSMLGVNSEESTAMTPVQFQERLQSFTASSPHTASPSGGRVYRISRPNGETRYLRMEVRQEGQAQFGLIEDVTMTTFERLRIEHERDYDTLTGLYNRQAFQRESEALFSEPKQLKHAALLMLDMDNLKYTNDTYGHDWGDQYIRQTGRCFADYTPKDTLCARISGDEFHFAVLRLKVRMKSARYSPICGTAAPAVDSASGWQGTAPEHFRRHRMVSGGWHTADTLKSMRTLPCIRSSIPAKVHSVNLTLAATIRKPTPCRPALTCTD